MFIAKRARAENVPKMAKKALKINKSILRNKYFKIPMALRDARKPTCYNGFDFKRIRSAISKIEEGWIQTTIWTYNVSRFFYYIYSNLTLRAEFLVAYSK